MYSLGHLHLLLNHLPIIVTGLGLLMTVIAVLRRRETLARVALAFFVGGAVSALPTYLTGEPAEDMVEDLPGITKALIERHEDAAIVAAIIVGILGAFALWALWNYRRPRALPTWVLSVALVGALAGSGAMAWTGLLGGEVRHTEIRSGFAAPAHAEGAGEN